ncbi:MAG: HNH endonuclease [Actinobacteria bacterium]|nr:HNH endonuclease [Actinomycetota bacterium]
MAWPKGQPRSAATRAKISSHRIPLAERFWSKVDRRGPDACWPWLAPLLKTGYGQISFGGNRTGLAHRVSWELAYGPIPNGITIDHHCHNIDPDCPGGVCKHRRCVNPAHLRLRTLSDNVLAGKSQPAVFARRDRCGKGHLFDAGNTYKWAHGHAPGARHCKRCRADMEARRRKRINNRCPICDKQINPGAMTCLAHRPSSVRRRP